MVSELYFLFFFTDDFVLFQQFVLEFSIFMNLAFNFFDESLFYWCKLLYFEFILTIDHLNLGLNSSQSIDFNLLFSLYCIPHIQIHSYFIFQLWSQFFDEIMFGLMKNVLRIYG